MNKAKSLTKAYDCLDTVVFSVHGESKPAVLDRALALPRHRKWIIVVQNWTQII